MASSKHEDGHKILERFTKMYAAMDDLADFCGSVLKDVGDRHEKKNHFTALLSQTKIIRGALEEMHHSIGHSWFGECWTGTKVGEEFVPKLAQALLEEVTRGIEGLHMQLLGPDDPIPESVPAELRAQIEELRKSQAKSSKAFEN